MGGGGGLATSLNTELSAPKGAILLHSGRGRAREVLTDVLYEAAS